jgi:hypothetical protein
VVQAGSSSGIRDDVSIGAATLVAPAPSPAEARTPPTGAVALKALAPGESKSKLHDRQNRNDPVRAVPHSGHKTIATLDPSYDRIR